eukprot:267828_1
MLYSISRLILYLYGIVSFWTVNKERALSQEYLNATQCMSEYYSSNILQPQHFYIEDIQTNTNTLISAQELIKDSIPIKLSFRNQSNVFKDYHKYFGKYTDSQILYNSHHSFLKNSKISQWPGFLSYFADFNEFARYVTNGFPIVMLRHSGNLYEMSSTHLATKRISIIPSEGMEYFNKYIDETDAMHPLLEMYNVSNTEWKKRIPEYYEFDLKQNEMIIFNQCDLMHRFENVKNENNEYPIAYSLRLTKRNRKQKDMERGYYFWTNIKGEYVTKTLKAMISKIMF